VLAQEVAAGRVAWTADGGYALDPACFSPDALAGLRWLSGARPEAADDRPTPIDAGVTATHGVSRSESGLAISEDAA
jgi:hypothetical protein